MIQCKQNEEVSAKVNLVVVVLLHLLGLPQSHHLLVLVEVLHLELTPELQDLLCLALPLGSLADLLPEALVQLLEILLLLRPAHEEEGRQLWVFLLKLLPVLGRKHLYVVSHSHLLFIPLELYLLLLQRSNVEILVLFLLGLVDRFGRYWLWLMMLGLPILLGLEVEEVVEQLCSQALAVGFQLKDGVLIIGNLRVRIICCYILLRSPSNCSTLPPMHKNIDPTRRERQSGPRTSQLEGCADIIS